VSKRPSKQQIERAIFNAVYDEAQYAAVEHRDRPDFAVFRHSDHTRGFGVEITEVYTTESNARLENIEGYFADLIAGKPHRHKDDIDELKVEIAQILDEDGHVKIKDLPVVMQNHTPERQLPMLLAARIEEKNALVAGYADDLSHVNLVIADRSGNPTPKPGEAYDVRDFVSPAVKDVLNRCSFNEVHLVQTVDNGVQIQRPLRMMALLEAGFGFNQAGGSVVEAGTDLPDEDVHSLFVEACSAHGLSVEYVNNQDQGGVFAQYGGVGLQFTDSGIRLLALSDYPPADPSTPPPRTMDAELATRILEAYEELITTNVFRCALELPAVKSFRDSIQESSQT
jgi:hypothetical protein